MQIGTSSTSCDFVLWKISIIDFLMLDKKIELGKFPDFVVTTLVQHVTPPKVDITRWQVLP
jgi:hypothetical protein